ncbi:uncharacterized protein LOC110461605 [Mizuhopecten yessoensis]|uniref:uncharacterized protein LOC110461605 n=1 Tax=Mizuhopecten yessoensis TaxID=6573 RepID=UPI000B45AFB2|nr:uncharacterized protein LOC110461605 [Mizuhopecten yessoensis]
MKEMKRYHLDILGISECRWTDEKDIFYDQLQKVIEKAPRHDIILVTGDMNAKSYGIPQKLINMIRAMYNNSECAVLNENGMTEWFTVKSGVKQGCNMSGFLSLLVIDWIMRATTNSNNTGIRWNLTTKLEEIDYAADDIALLSSTRSRERIQQKTSLLNNYSKQQT